MRTEERAVDRRHSVAVTIRDWIIFVYPNCSERQGNRPWKPEKYTISVRQQRVYEITNKKEESKRMWEAQR